MQRCNIFSSLLKGVNFGTKWYKDMKDDELKTINDGCAIQTAGKRSYFDK